MPIELTCTSCGRQLRVPDEHAGKQARCPACGNVAQIPLPSPFSSQPTVGGQQQFGNQSAANPFGNTGPNYSPSNPFAENFPPNTNPYVVPSSAGMLFQGKPHRGGLILTFGILGLCCCGFFGIAALAMGYTDLREMREGRMDPSGQATTQVGFILGIVSCVLTGIYLLFFVISSAVQA